MGMELIRYSYVFIIILVITLFHYTRRSIADHCREFTRLHVVDEVLPYWRCILLNAFAK